MATVALVADAQVWLPSERFETRDGIITGYALEEGGWIVLLTEETREVVHVHADEVLERDSCRPREESFELEGFPSLLQLAIREDAKLPEPIC